jgi:hypothetical protein
LQQLALYLQELEGRGMNFPTGKSDRKTSTITRRRVGTVNNASSAGFNYQLYCKQFSTPE